MARLTPDQRKADRLRRKVLASESLPDFLARMAVVWEARQQARVGLDARRAQASMRAARRHVVDVPALVAAVPNSVFSLGALASRGAAAQRRDGGSAPMDADSFKAATWRAPWAAPYALSKPGRTP